MNRIIAAGFLLISFDCLSQQADTASALKVYTLGDVLRAIERLNGLKW
jgi:hypothetical protein